MDREVIIRTPRTELTSWRPGDVDDLLGLHSDPMTMRFVRHGRPETRGETAALIEDYIDEHARRGWTKWRIADHDAHLIGVAGLGLYGTYQAGTATYNGLSNGQ